MDLLLLFGAFTMCVGYLIGCLFMWLWLMSMSQPKRTPYRYDVQDEADMIVEALEL